jgi:hypothetical protein
VRFFKGAETFLTPKSLEITYYMFCPRQKKNNITLFKNHRYIGILPYVPTHIFGHFEEFFKRAKTFLTLNCPERSDYISKPPASECFFVRPFEKSANYEYI